MGWWHIWGKSLTLVLTRLVVSQGVASMAGWGQSKGLITRETPSAPMLLRAFFKGSEETRTLAEHCRVFGRVPARWTKVDRAPQVTRWFFVLDTVAETLERGGSSFWFVTSVGATRFLVCDAQPFRKCQNVHSCNTMIFGTTMVLCSHNTKDSSI